MQVPITLYLIGFAGSGKYTIAKEIVKSTDYKIVDNHSAIESGKELIDIDHQNALTLDVTDLTAQQAAKQILDFVAKTLSR